MTNGMQLNPGLAVIACLMLERTGRMFLWISSMGPGRWKSYHSNHQQDKLSSAEAAWPEETALLTSLEPDGNQTMDILYLCALILRSCVRHTCLALRQTECCAWHSPSRMCILISSECCGRLLVFLLRQSSFWTRRETCLSFFSFSSLSYHLCVAPLVHM